MVDIVVQPWSMVVRHGETITVAEHDKNGGPKGIMVRDFFDDW